MATENELIEDIESMSNEEARAYLYPLLEQNYEDAEIWKAMGILYLRTDDLAQSRECFTRYFKFSGEAELKI